VLKIVGDTISIMLLITTITASLLLPGVNSVRIAIVRNLCSAILLADLVFVVGIQVYDELLRYFEIISSVRRAEKT